MGFESVVSDYGGKKKVGLTPENLPFNFFFLLLHLEK